MFSYFLGKEPKCLCFRRYCYLSHVLITRKWDHSDTQKCNTGIDQSQSVQLMQGSLLQLSTLVGVTSHWYFRYFFFFGGPFYEIPLHYSEVLFFLSHSLSRNLVLLFACLCSLQADLDVLLWLMNSINNAQISGLTGTTYSCKGVEVTRRPSLCGDSK